MKNILYTRLIRPKVKNTVTKNKIVQDKLRRIEENKLLIVRGGPAVGKSTLISDFIKNKHDYMWFSLDKSSDDLSCFWTYIFYGLKDNISNANIYVDRINPLVKKEDIFDIISSLINDLINCDDLFIVLDDFQNINDSFIMKTIEFFIENTSYNVHFIIISRADIPLYLGNILMKGGVIDISGDELRFSRKETREFIEMTSSTEVSDNFIEDIYAKSEGWIGAIKLLLTASNNNRKIENIPQNNSLFIDYMNKEIISSLNNEEIDFLVATSPLTYVNPDIYKCICSIDGWNIMNGLLKKNILITIIDEDKKIYRYHNILREYLIKLFDKYDNQKKELNITSITNFLMEENNYDEAMNIFMEWERYDDALELLESKGQNLIGTKFVNGFPLEYYSKSLDLAMLSLFYNFLNLNYERNNVINEYIMNLSYDKKIETCTKLYNALIGNSDCSFADEVMEGNYNVLTKIIYCILKSCILSSKGECNKALDMLELSYKLNKKLDNKNFYIIMEYSRAIILEKMAKLNESKEVYYRLDEYLNAKKYNACYDTFKSVGLPGVFIKQCNYKEAERLLNHAVDVIEKYKDKEAFKFNLNNIYYNLAEVKYIEGNIEECEKLINITDENTEDNYNNIVFKALKIMLLSLENKLCENEYGDFCELYKHLYGGENNSSEIDIAYGISLFKMKEYKESLDVFNKVIFLSRKNEIIYCLIYALLWKVILLKNVNELKYEKDDFKNNTDEDNINKYSEREILNNLKEAIFYSREEDILFPYYKNRMFLKDIIKYYEVELLKDKNNKEFIKKIFDVMISKYNQEKSYLEELTQREKEVLECIAEGQTNKEIGEKLFISTATVKTHIINIYSKLNVKNRVEAVNLVRTFSN